MKLHLPKGLRAALLAVVTVSSAHVAVAAAPATYGYLPTKSTTYFFDAEAVGRQTISINTPDMSRGWVMSVAGRLYPHKVMDGTFYGGATLIGNADVEFYKNDIASDKVRPPHAFGKNDFAIVFSEGKWNLHAVTKGEAERLTSTGDIPMDPANRPTLQVTLNWVPGADGKGTLYLTEVATAKIVPTAYIEGTYTPSEVRVETLETLSDEKITLLKNVQLTNEKMAELGGLRAVTSADVGKSELATVLYATGSGDDPKAWMITGTADVETLLNNGYLTDEAIALAEEATDGEAGGEGAVEGDGTIGDDSSTGEGEVGGGEPSVPEVTPETALVQFTGSKGVLFLNRPADYDPANGEYMLTYDRVTTVENNILEGDAGKKVGFGAAEGTKLVVGPTALSADVLATEMKILGTGTVKLEMGAASAANLVHLDPGANLEIKNDTFLNLNMTEVLVGAGSSITRTEDSAAGDMTVTVNAGATKPATISMASLENQNGGLSIVGSQQTETGLSYTIVKVDELAASGDIKLSGDITSKTVTAGGDLNVGSIDNPYALLNAESATAGGNLAVHGAADIETIKAGSVEVNVIEDEATAVNAGSIEAASLTYNLVSFVESEVVPPAEGEVVALAEGDSAPVAGEEGQVEYERVSSSITISASEPARLLSGNVRLNTAGISASAIADGATINMDSTCDAKVKLGSAAGLNLTIDGESSIMKDVDARNLELATKSIKASSISAGTISLTDGYALSGASIAAPAVARTTGVAINVQGDGVQLSNLHIGEGVVLTTPGKATLNNVTFNKDVSFGGVDGDAQTISDPDSVVINGSLDGGKLIINQMVINAANLDFDKAGEFEIIASEDTVILPKDTEKDVVYNVQSYVEVELKVDKETGAVKIRGEKKEEEFKKQLLDTENRRQAMAALDSLSPKNGTPLAQLISDLGQVNIYKNPETRRELLSAISGSSTTAIADSQRRGIQDVQKSLRNRVIQMGGGTNKGLTSDWDYIGLQAWAQADGSFISTDSSDDQSGYDFNTWGATVGANIDLTANTVVGMSFSASYGELDVDSSDSASGNNDAYYVSFYARHQKERWVQMLILTAGMNDIDMERTVGLGANRYTGNGTTDGTTLSAYYELGYTVGLNYEFTHILQPLVSVSLTSAKVDGYREDGSIGNAGLTYDGDSYFYGTVGIGARYQGVMYETVHERNAVLEARALVTQDFGDKTDEAMVGVGTSELYKVTGADSTGTGFELGAGLSLPVEQHTTVYADVDVTFRPDSTGFRGNIGLRYDF